MVTIERVSRTVDPILAELRDVEASTLASLIHSVRIGRDRVAIRLDRTTLATRLTLPPEALDEALLAFEAPFSLRRRGIEAKIIAGSLATAADPNLHRTLLNAHCSLGALKTNRSIADIARERGHSESYIRTRLPLALLSPRIQAAILNGSIGPTVTVDPVVRADLPSNWTEQELRLGMPSQ
jgi:site-specific DNA recombinase